MRISVFKCLVLIGVLFTGISAWAQELGFYQRKVFLEIDGQGQFPLFQNLFGESKGYVQKSGSLQSSYNLLDAGFRVSLNATNDEYSGYGLELAQRFYWMNLSNGSDFGRKYSTSGGTVEENIPAKMAFVPIRETVIMPRFFTSINDSRIPVGFCSEFGIGYALISIADRHPGILVDSSASYTADQVNSRLLDARVERFNGLNFMYGFRMNFPLSERVLFHVGFRYQYSILFGKKKYRNMDESEYWFSPKEIWQKLNLRRQLGIMSFGAGITIML